MNKKIHAHYRLDDVTADMINQLTHILDTTKTEIIERAIKNFHKKVVTKKHKNELAPYAGKLSDGTAEIMDRIVEYNRKVENDRNIDITD